MLDSVEYARHRTMDLHVLDLYMLESPSVSSSPESLGPPVSAQHSPPHTLSFGSLVSHEYTMLHRTTALPPLGLLVLLA